MTDWRPTSPHATAMRRSQICTRIRDYFDNNDVLAVDTPSLSRYAISDPNIDSLTVHSRFCGDYFLHTSPEICMKRLLAAGYPDIYSICRVYRDGEAGSRHLPEFTMVEWYRRDFGLEAIIADTIRLIAAAIDDPELGKSVEILDYAEAMQQHAGIDVFNVTEEDLATVVDADAQLRHEMRGARDAWLDLIMATIVAPRLAQGRLTVIRHYPASQAALARLCPADDRLADRFEVFFADMELANGYVELSDAKEQRRRINHELDIRQELSRPVAPWDRSLIAALDAGLPDCAGVALGLERLHMVMDRAGNISDVVTFPTDVSIDG